MPPPPLWVAGLSAPRETLARSLSLRQERAAGRAGRPQGKGACATGRPRPPALCPPQSPPGHSPATRCPRRAPAPGGSEGAMGVTGRTRSQSAGPAARARSERDSAAGARGRCDGSCCSWGCGWATGGDRQKPNSSREGTSSQARRLPCSRGALRAIPRIPGLKA